MFKRTGGVGDMRARDTFLITKKTKAIVTNTSAYYRSVILENKQKYYSHHSAEQIIDYNCTLFGESLAGRRTAIKNNFNINNKIPIPVNPNQAVYLMPTSSTKSKDCVWLSYYHIDFYEQYNQKTYVTFMDGTGLYVNASANSIDMQHKRTSQIIARQHRILFFTRSFPQSFMSGGPFIH